MFSWMFMLLDEQHYENYITDGNDNKDDRKHDNDNEN